MMCPNTLPDRDVNYRLALTIGYSREQIYTAFTSDDVYVLFNNNWEKFNYKEWRTISPIAEKYDMFPSLSGFFPGDWVCTGEYRYYAKTPQRAIAQAVVEDFYVLS